jgi:hypothetical protein
MFSVGFGSATGALIFYEDFLRAEKTIPVERKSTPPIKEKWQRTPKGEKSWGLLFR